jgi:hypothetical protein
MASLPCAVCPAGTFFFQIITSVTDNQGMQKVGDVETIDVEMIDSSEALKEERK